VTIWRQAEAKTCLQVLLSNFLKLFLSTLMLEVDPPQRNCELLEFVD